MQESSKDNGGDKIYLRKKDFPDKFRVKPIEPVSTQGDLPLKDSPQYYVINPKDLDEFILDTHDHLIIKHDLFNHDGLTQDGIAEAFTEFAKKEELSFS
jgi:type I restriction enzyme M protein